MNQNFRYRPKMTDAGIEASYPVTVTDEYGNSRETHITGERPLIIYVDKQEIVTLMTLGKNPELLVIGYLHNQGFIKNIEDIKEIQVDWDVDSAVVDPKNFKNNSFVSRKIDECIIPPNSFALASTVEYFKIPKDVLVICLGKSTYARCGIIVNVTPLEPGWEGHVTLEFSNTTPLPAKIYANEGAAQFIFLKGNEEPTITYEKRNGKYMKQTGVTLPKV